jgi:hypothetical protein
MVTDDYSVNASLICVRLLNQSPQFQKRTEAMKRHKRQRLGRFFYAFGKQS